MCVLGGGGQNGKRTPRLWHLLATQQGTEFLYAVVIDKYPWGPKRVRSLKPWLYLFSTDDPHSQVVRNTHSQVRTAITVVRPSPRSHANSQVR